LSRGDGSAFYKRLADKWGTKNFSPGREETVAKGAPLTTAEMVQAWEEHDRAKSRMLEWMKSYDVFLTPVNAKYAQPIDQENNTGGDAGAAGGGWPYTGAFNSTGWPVVVVRCGTSTEGKLPIGVQVVAKPWREDICLTVASYLESKSGGWQKPPI
jgi:amidase